MNLREIVEKYLSVAGEYGKFVAIGSLGLPHEEAERVFSAFDEDYHISRFLRFQAQSGQRFSICGYPQTHISIDAAIQSIL
jgi:hypothetical protein